MGAQSDMELHSCIGTGNVARVLGRDRRESLNADRWVCDHSLDTCPLLQT